MMEGKEGATERIRPLRKFGQNFLICREIAKKEAQFGQNKNVIELGPGHGMLTKELCAVSNHVTAIEIDKRLYNKMHAELIEGAKAKNLKLINADFFSLNEKDMGKSDIFISNIPYNVSSKLLNWLIKNDVEAVLCLQKEFVDHMLAKPSSKKYSRLSVFSHLFFDLERIAAVPSTCFYPKPKVDSEIIHIKKKKNIIVDNDEMAIISVLMEHKKKRFRNALIDSHKKLGISKDKAAAIASQMAVGERIFKMNPEELLACAREIINIINKK